MNAVVGTLRVLRIERAILARKRGATSVFWCHNGQAAVWGPAFYAPQRVRVPRRACALMESIGYSRSSNAGSTGQEPA